MFGLLLDTAIPIRSKADAGKPFDSFCQVLPPSVVLYSAVSPPPLSKRQGRRRNVYMPAYSVCGLDGSITISEQPVSGLRYSTFCQVRPPSVVRNTPRSSFGPQAWPRAHTSATSGFWG